MALSIKVVFLARVAKLEEEEEVEEGGRVGSHSQSKAKHNTAHTRPAATGAKRRGKRLCWRSIGPPPPPPPSSFLILLLPPPSFSLYMEKEEEEDARYCRKIKKKKKQRLSRRRQRRPSSKSRGRIFFFFFLLLPSSFPSSSPVCITLSGTLSRKE